MKQQAMEPGRAVSEPLVERLLRDANSALADLSRLRRTVMAGGLSAEQLPGDVEMQSFALLGESGRAAIEQMVVPHLALLVGKGLLRDVDITRVPAPTLRFFATVAPLLVGVLGVAQRMQAGIEAIRDGGAAQGLGPAIRCAHRASGFLGQTLIVQAQLSGAAWALVRPDAVFDQRENLVRVEENVTLRFEVPCDEGEVLLAAMDHMGNVSVHELRISLAEGDGA